VLDRHRRSDRHPGQHDRRYLDIAIREAEAGLAEGGIPIGACLVRNGEVLGSGHHGRVQRGDPTAHGEIEAIRAAGRQRQYRDTVIYTMLMPCHMYAGTIVQFGVPRVVVGEADTFPVPSRFFATTACRSRSCPTVAASS
jgi:creatinine deaminase